jgi:hypothetical protein
MPGNWQLNYQPPRAKLRFLDLTNGVVAMRSVRRLLLISTVSTCCLVPFSGWAGCNRPIVVPIHFQQGAFCWQHSGIGTTFTGDFGARQRVTVAAHGQFENSDGTRTWVTTGPWQISISGPGGFFTGSENGQIEAILPASGPYTFEIGPCAVWGNQGMIEICAQ